MRLTEPRLWSPERKPQGMVFLGSFPYVVEGTPGLGPLKGNGQLDGFSWGHSMSPSLRILASASAVGSVGSEGRTRVASWNATTLSQVFHFHCLEGVAVSRSMFVGISPIGQGSTSSFS